MPFAAGEPDVSGELTIFPRDEDQRGRTAPHPTQGDSRFWKSTFA